MHIELFALLEQAEHERGLRIAVSAPRGHAKSTIVSLAYLAWCVCYAKEPFILLVSDTGDQAKDALKALRTELRTNDRIESDFPQVRLGERGGNSWRQGDILVGGVRVTALGAGEKVRGRRNAQSRPTLIIGDDLENEELVRSPEQRENRSEWFHSALMKAGTPQTNIIVIGTVLHHDALLARLQDPARSPGWTIKRYQAVEHWAERGEMWDRWESIYNHLDHWPEDSERSGPEAARGYFAANRQAMLEGAKALWPESIPYEYLMELRVREGRHSFATEMQNEPADPQSCIFRLEEIHFWDDPSTGISTVEQLADSLPDGGLYVYGACDPSLGKLGRRNDDTAIVLLMKDTHKQIMYVIHADIRKRTPNDTIEAILAYDYQRKIFSFAVEETQFQEMLKTDLERRAWERRRNLRVQGLRPTSDKNARIASMHALIASGRVRLSRRHVTLLEQLLRFPHAAHDDGPDALQMAVSIANTPEARWVGLCYE